MGLEFSLDFSLNFALANVQVLEFLAVVTEVNRAVQCQQHRQ